ncbi:MAG: hypothetical protein A2Y10_04470 [Planctomycetes bacterium GWF2_41_51]|nr:MAG: hypothetical protein A2Y10_04470 [Planctomycetes bacterium GWF2_41_51]HBG27039.1 hypothetical protein [Phycisphaerales bacterium]
MFRSIRTKIMVLQIGLVLAVTVSLGIISYMLTFSSLRESQKQNLEYMSEYVEGQIKAALDNKEQLLEKIGHSETMTNYYKKQQENFLAGYLEKFKQEFEILSYVNESGREELKLINGRVSTNYYNVSNSLVFQRAISNANKAFSWYNPYSSELKGPCIEFGICDKDFFDDFTGFILGKISVPQLTQDIKEFEQKENALVLLVDSDRTILACPDKGKELKKFEIKGKEGLRILAEIKMAKTGYGRADILGNDSFVSYTPVEGQDWSVVLALPYHIFSAKLDALRNTVVLIGFTILVIGVMLSLYVSVDITKPILELLKSTSLIATGDFSQRVNTNSKDELGKLATAFNQMTENLQNTTTSMVNLNREIIERQKAEALQHSLNEKLEKSIKNLTVVNRELADFAHVAAHDLKAPLRAVGSLAGILMSDYGNKLDERGKYYLDTLVRRTERMSELISGILTYSELGRDTEISPVSINAIVRETITNLEVPENIEIILESDFPTVLCGKTHMQQVFGHLLGNAIKYIDKPKGTVKVKCTEDGDYWVFSVSDNGCGIEEKYFERIFKIFQTLVRRDEEESTGIGLSVVKRIVEKYNGKIWVESKPGIGSTFFFTLRKEKKVVNNEKLQANFVS